MGKGHQHKSGIHHTDDQSHGGGQVIIQQHHENQADKQHGGADLAGHQRAFEHFSLAVVDKTCNELKALLDDKQRE